MPENEIKILCPVDRTMESIRDWPNEAGFQTLHEEREPIELDIKGKIPAWAAGTLYRTGPASKKVTRAAGQKDFEVSHWFDGFGHTHRFEIVSQEDGSSRVRYNSRRANDKLIERAKETGITGTITFGQKADPCVGIFGKVMSVFTRATNRDPGIANVAVTIKPNYPGLTAITSGSTPGHTKIRSLWATTDGAGLKQLDPKTLEPLALTSQKTLHPDLTGPLSCAHAHTDPKTGDVYNFNLAFGRHPTYRIFKTSALTGETEILATISGSGVKAAYLHSFFLTPDYLILAIWGSHIAGSGLKIIKEGNMLDALSPWNSQEKNRWVVIDRKNGNGVVKEFESDASFCFHSVNAWQEGNDIICEYPEYENTDIIHGLYYRNMTSNSPNAETFARDKGESYVPHMVRYRLSNITKEKFGQEKGNSLPKAEKILSLPKRYGGDLPTINPSFAMRETRYIYGIVNRGFSSFLDGISKVDMKTKEVLYWDNPKGHTPGEAIFVARPGAEVEDDGVLLSVVLDGFKEESYLVCIDAVTMEEIGRAEVGAPIGFGFHGCHVP